MSVTAMSVIRESIVLKLRASLPSSSSVCTRARTRNSPSSARAITRESAWMGLSRK